MQELKNEDGKIDSSSTDYWRKKCHMFIPFPVEYRPAHACRACAVERKMADNWQAWLGVDSVWFVFHVWPKGTRGLFWWGFSLCDLSDTDTHAHVKFIISTPSVVSKAVLILIGRFTLRNIHWKRCFKINLILVHFRFSYCVLWIILK